MNDMLPVPPYLYIDLQWFAAEDEGRTEEPSEYKLEKARREGRVAKSAELNSAFVMLLCVVLLIVFAPSMLKECTGIFRYYFSRCASSSVNDPAIARAYHSKPQLYLYDEDDRTEVSKNRSELRSVFPQHAFFAARTFQRREIAR